jgi:hypothetical protein
MIVTAVVCYLYHTVLRRDAVVLDVTFRLITISPPQKVAILFSLCSPKITSNMLR